MRAYERFRMPKFNHPEDMKKIIEYLEKNGKINISYKKLEDLYYDYSDSVACGWRMVDDTSLEQFADYLERCELCRGNIVVHEWKDYDEDE